MSSVTLIVSPTRFQYLERHPTLSGEPESPLRSFTVKITKSPSRSHHRHSEPPLALIQHSAALLNDERYECPQQPFPNPAAVAKRNYLPPPRPGRRTIVKENTDIFVKWTEDPEQIEKLAHEAEMYSKDLSRLQGRVVPKLVGYYVNRTVRPTFACLLLELLDEDLTVDKRDFNAEMIYLTEKIHAAGINHGQLSSKQSRQKHFVTVGMSLRIVDFTKAKRHECALSEKPLGGASERWVQPPAPCAEVIYMRSAAASEAYSRRSSRPSKQKSMSHLKSEISNGSSSNMHTTRNSPASVKRRPSNIHDMYAPPTQEFASLSMETYRGYIEGDGESGFKSLIYNMRGKPPPPPPTFLHNSDEDCSRRPSSSHTYAPPDSRDHRDARRQPSRSHLAPRPSMSRSDSLPCQVASGQPLRPQYGQYLTPPEIPLSPFPAHVRPGRHLDP